MKYDNTHIFCNFSFIKVQIDLTPTKILQMGVKKEYLLLSFDPLRWGLDIVTLILGTSDLGTQNKSET